MTFHIFNFIVTIVAVISGCLCSRMAARIPSGYGQVGPAIVWLFAGMNLVATFFKLS